MEPVLALASKKDNKEPAIPTSKPIKFYNSLQANQSDLSLIKLLKIRRLFFS